MVPATAERNLKSGVKQSRGCRETDAGVNLAARNRLGIYRPARGPHLPETERNENRGAEIWFRFQISIKAELGNVFQLARICRDGAA